MPSPANIIQLKLVVARIATLADGGLRLTFDASEDAIVEAAQLMECKRRGVVLAAEFSASEEPGYTFPEV